MHGQTAFARNVGVFCCFVLGVVMLFAGFAKSLTPDSLIDVLRYDGFSDPSARALRYAVIITEIILGSCLVALLTPRVVLNFTILLLLVYSVQLGVLLGTQSAPACNCFSLLHDFESNRQANFIGLGRNAVLLSLAYVARRTILHESSLKNTSIRSPQNGDRAVYGFTIIELMVTLVIIMVVLGLVIASVLAFRASAEKTNCASNLRQLGIASITYAQNNRGYIHRTATYWRPHWIWWTHAMQIELGMRPLLSERQLHRSAVFQCPSHPNKGIPTGYVVNSCVFDRDGEFGRLIAGMVKLSQISKPERVAYLLEASNQFEINNENNERVGIYYIIFHKVWHPRDLPTGVSPRVSLNRHKKVSNALFFDGHVAEITSVHPKLLDDGIRRAKDDRSEIIIADPELDQHESGLPFEPGM